MQTLNVADPEKQVHLIEARFQTHRLLATTPEDESTTSSTRATAIYQNVVWLCLAVLSFFFKKWQRKGGESRPPVLVKLLKAKLNWFKHRRQTGLSIYIKYVLQCLWSAIEGCSSGHPSELLMQQAAVGFITTAQYIYINTKASTYVRVFYLIKDDQQCNSMSLIMKTDLHRSFIVDIWPQGGISFQTNCSMIG